jgi:hypothetical protein
MRSLSKLVICEPSIQRRSLKQRTPLYLPTGQSQSGLGADSEPRYRRLRTQYRCTQLYPIEPQKVKIRVSRCHSMSCSKRKNMTKTLVKRKFDQFSQGFPKIGLRKEGFEPPRPFGHRILSPARLPVPPLPHFCAGILSRRAAGRRQASEAARARFFGGKVPLGANADLSDDGDGGILSLCGVMLHLLACALKALLSVPKGDRQWLIAASAARKLPMARLFAASAANQ